MCHIKVTNPVFCPCNNEDCMQVRPTEVRASVHHNLPKGAHIVRAEEYVITNGLPCSRFFTTPGAEGVVTTGGGDRAMSQLAVQLCPNLHATIKGTIQFDEERCKKCQAKCTNTIVSTYGG